MCSMAGHLSARPPASSMAMGRSQYTQSEEPGSAFKLIGANIGPRRLFLEEDLTPYMYMYKGMSVQCTLYMRKFVHKIC